MSVSQTPSPATMLSMLSRERILRLKSDKFTCCLTETERGDHDLCLSRSHFTETNPTNKEREVARSIDSDTPFPNQKEMNKFICLRCAGQQGHTSLREGVKPQYMPFPAPPPPPFSNYSRVNGKHQFSGFEI